VAVVASTLVFAYLAINWVIFSTVGIIFNLIYHYINAKWKFGLGGIFFITGVYFLVSSGEEGRVDSPESTDYDEMEDEEEKKQD
jgi:hypothetical protein